MTAVSKLMSYFRKRNPPSMRMAENPLYSHYKIGRHTYGYPTIVDWNKGVSLTIGSFCSFATIATILLGGDHRHDRVTTSPLGAMMDIPDAPEQFATRGNVVIGSDVWVGHEAMILGGVDIRDGAVVAARAVVTRSVQPYDIVAGSPARVVNRRFDSETVSKLLLIKWWDWADDDIRLRASELLSCDVMQFAKRYSVTK